MHARAVHDERPGLGVEEVVAHGEAFRFAPGPRGIVAQLELGMHRMARRVERDLGLEIGRVHE